MNSQNENRKRFSIVYWRRTTWVDRFGEDGISGNLNVKKVLVGASSESTKLEKDFDTYSEAAKYLVSLVRGAVIDRLDVDYECWFGVNILTAHVLAAVAEIRQLHVVYNTIWPENEKLEYYCDRIAPLFWDVPKLTSQCYHGHEWKSSSFCEGEVPTFKKVRRGKKTLDIAGMFCPHH